MAVTTAVPSWQSASSTLVETPSVYVSNGRVVAPPHGGSLPQRCACCGGEASKQRKEKFSEAPKWIIVTVLIGLIFPLLLSVLLSKRGSLTIWRCSRCIGHIRWKKAGGAAILIAALVGVGVGLGSGTFALAGAGFALMVLGLVVSSGAPKVKREHVTAEVLTVTGVHPDVMALLPSR